MARKKFGLDDPEIPHRSGVYVVRDGAKRVLDIGESAKVGKRIEKHDRRSCWIENAVGNVTVEVHWTPGKQKTGRLAVEKKLRDKHGPPCGVR